MAMHDEIVDLMNEAACLREALEYALQQLEAYDTTKVGVHQEAIKKARAALSRRDLLRHKRVS